jgi:hypothetical protein
MSSAAAPVEIIPGIAKAIPGSGENRSPSRRNHCSPSARNHRSSSPRNRFHVHPGILFALPRNPHWSLATSFGTGDRLQSFSGTWGEVNNALFAGGDFRIYQRDISDRSLILAIRSKWPFSDEEVAVRILKMISFERAFWRDYDFPYYLVTCLLSDAMAAARAAAGSPTPSRCSCNGDPHLTMAFNLSSLMRHFIPGTHIEWLCCPIPALGCRGSRRGSRRIIRTPSRSVNPWRLNRAESQTSALAEAMVYGQLLIPQCDHRVDPRCAARRQVASQQGNAGQQHRCR